MEFFEFFVGKSGPHSQNPPLAARKTSEQPSQQAEVSTGDSVRDLVSLSKQDGNHTSSVLEQGFKDRPDRPANERGTLAEVVTAMEGQLTPKKEAAVQLKREQDNAVRKSQLRTPEKIQKQPGAKAKDPRSQKITELEAELSKVHKENEDLIRISLKEPVVPTFGMGHGLDSRVRELEEMVASLKAENEELRWFRWDDVTAVSAAKRIEELTEMVEARNRRIAELEGRAGDKPAQEADKDVDKAESTVTKTLTKPTHGGAWLGLPRYMQPTFSVLPKYTQAPSRTPDKHSPLGTRGHSFSGTRTPAAQTPTQAPSPAGASSQTPTPTQAPAPAQAQTSPGGLRSKSFQEQMTSTSPPPRDSDPRTGGVASDSAPLASPRDSTEGHTGPAHHDPHLPRFMQPTLSSQPKARDISRDASRDAQSKPPMSFHVARPIPSDVHTDSVWASATSTPHQPQASPRDSLDLLTQPEAHSAGNVTHAHAASHVSAATPGQHAAGHATSPNGHVTPLPTHPQGLPRFMQPTESIQRRLGKSETEHAHHKSSRDKGSSHEATRDKALDAPQDLVIAEDTLATPRRNLLGRSRSDFGSGPRGQPEGSA